MDQHKNKPQEQKGKRYTAYKIALLVLGIITLKLVGIAAFIRMSPLARLTAKPRKSGPIA